MKCVYGNGEFDLAAQGIPLSPPRLWQRGPTSSTRIWRKTMPTKSFFQTLESVIKIQITVENFKVILLIIVWNFKRL